MMASDLSRMLELVPGIVAIGTDLLDSRRIDAVYHRHGQRLVQRLLTPAEREIWCEHRHQVNFLAKRFAAKEAIAKALGTGIAQGVSFQHMDVIRDEHGAPQVMLSGVAKERMLFLGGQMMLLSLSDEQHWIQAFAVLSR